MFTWVFFEFSLQFSNLKFKNHSKQFFDYGKIHLICIYTYYITIVFLSEYQIFINSLFFFLLNNYQMMRS